MDKAAVDFSIQSRRNTIATVPVRKARPRKLLFPAGSEPVGILHLNRLGELLMQARAALRAPGA